MRIFTDILLFRRMIAPSLLQLFFWAGVGGTCYGAYVLLSRGHWAWWIALVCGILATRIIVETAILAFRSFERLGEIRDLLAERGRGR